MLKFSFIHLIFILNLFYESVSCSKILYVSLTSSPSHNIWDRTLALALKDRAHDITYVTHSVEKSYPNFTTITLEGIYDKIYDDFDLLDVFKAPLLDLVETVGKWVLATCQHDLKTQGYQKVLKLAKDNVKFDLIIMDVASAPCFYPFIELFGYPPTVGTCPFGIPTYVADVYNIQIDSSFIPYYAIEYYPPFTFFQRMFNYFINMYDITVKNHYWGKVQNALEEFYGRDMSHIMEIERNFSILLPNYDPVLNYPRSLPSNVIPVGCLHCKRGKSLSEDLQKYLDNSKEGVIIFSLGTNLRSDKFDENRKQIILNTFSKLKQNVIWKFESQIENLPKNVIVRKFLPQNDMLAHPNVKLLINHGGLLSTQEALYNGIPLISIPFFIDQTSIAHNIVQRKLGLRLSYQNLTEAFMYSTIQEVLYNPIYKENAMLVSKRSRDKPNSPLEVAIFWVEHVLRNNGAQYLRLASHNMPFYQRHLLDVWLFIIAIIVSIFIIAYSIVHYFYTRKYKNKPKVE